MKPSFETARTAVLSMDYQAGIVSIYAKDRETVLTRAQSVLKGARSFGMAVIHVRVAFRPGCPEISTRNLLLGAIRTSVQHQQLFQGATGAIHSAVAPEGDDIVVSKSRVSAFSGTDLEVILRAKEITTLVMFGIATSGVVLSTLLEAADRDYRLVVIGDCCVDLDQEMHAFLVEKLFPRQAAVVSASDFLNSTIEGGR